MSRHTESMYGFFCGGDPRNFHPDFESCTAQEIENHERACALWNEAEARGETPTLESCPSGWLHDDDGRPIMHILCAPYGIGVQTFIFDDDNPDDADLCAFFGDGK